MLHSNIKSVARNTAVMLAAQAITWASSFILMMFLPKYLGSNAYGELYLAVSIATMFQVIIEFGGQYQITKEVSRAHEDAPHVLVNAAVSRILLWALSIFLMIEFCRAVNYSWQVIVLVAILGTAKLWEGINNLLRNTYQGFEKMEYPSIGSVAERVFLMITAVTFLLAGFGQIMIASLMAISTLINFLISASFAKKIISFLPKIDFDKAKSLLKAGVPYFMWSLFATIYYRVDAIMLSLMTVYSVVGWYGAAYKLFDVLMFFPSIFSQALFPVLTKISDSGKKSLTNAVQRSLDVILFVGIPVSILLFMFAGQITAFLFGLKEYQNTIIILKIFSLGLILVYIDFVLGGTVLAIDKQKLWSVIAGAAVILNIGLNYFLIKYFQSFSGNGGIGAAIATIITEAFIMCSAVLILRGKLSGGIRFNLIFKEAFSGGIMAAAIDMLNAASTNWIIIAVSGLTIYLLVLFLFYAASKGKSVFSFEHAASIKSYVNEILFKGEAKA